MKRGPSNAEKHRVHRCFILFAWRRCRGCGLEFKWECGWRIVKRKKVVYVCGTCARTPSGAIAVLRAARLTRLLDRPPVPPKAPPAPPRTR